MIPYIHIGSFRLGTFGLMMWAAFVVAYFVLEADIRRRKLAADAQVIVLTTAIAGVLGAKVYHLVQFPSELFQGWLNVLIYGFAWFGGLLGGLAALIVLAYRYRVSVLAMLDLVAPAAAIGYGVGRIGCLLSGDGDYGRPTSLPWGISMPNGTVPTTEVCTQYGWPASCGVHPTPIYELLGAIAIFWFLWGLGRNTRSAGEITGWYFILTGAARFLVEFIRINPPIYFGLSNAQAVALGTLIAGIVLLLAVRRSPARSSL